ncbi:MAG: alpha-glucan family phosphorylase [Myxococcota bacterium]
MEARTGPADDSRDGRNLLPASNGPRVAYLSMEIALAPDIPTYSGGLGVLAGDTLRSCADLGVSVVGVSLVHRKGYFRQEIDPDGSQVEQPAAWEPEASLELQEPLVEVEIEGRTVAVRAWCYRIHGDRGFEVPVFLLDTDLPANDEPDRHLTDHLYGGDNAYRLSQEVVLGLGGLRMLRALGYDPLDRLHLNEGHAALAIPGLVQEARRADPKLTVRAAIERVRGLCVFTTHTPVPAGHDRFPRQLAEKILGPTTSENLDGLMRREELNMTSVALEGSRFVNGVAMRHGEVSRGMFPGYPIRSITNGIHPSTWAAPAFQSLFDERFPEWRSDPATLRGVIAVPPAQIAGAHARSKAQLLRAVREATGRRFSPDVLTLGFARRATAYKRPMLLLRDLDRLEEIAARRGALQIVFAGKAHPRDEEGQRLIREIHQAAEKTSTDVQIAFLPGYGMSLARVLVAGCDIWLNTPIPPMEASGTSGMKAALNGVPSLSVLDGWWVEGCVEDVTGWAIGHDGDGATLSPEDRDRLHAEELYEKLETTVIPRFYETPERFNAIRQQAISLNGSYFNTHRMVLQYLFEAYRETGSV